MTRLTAFLCIMLLGLQLSACDSDTPKAPEATASPPVVGHRPETAAAPTVLLLQEPIALQRGETVCDVLPVWRRFAAQRPTLLLLSNDPQLQPPPPQLRARIDRLLTEADDSRLRQAGSGYRPDPLYLPAMGIDLALRQKWVGRLVWALPLRDPDQELTVERLREQFTGNGLADAKEAATLTLTDRVFSGSLRDLPFQAAALDNLPQIAGPVLVHIDLSFFRNLYKNEIATPTLPLVHQVLNRLKKLQLPVLAVTFSYGHDNNGIPLDVRFIGSFLSDLLERPSRLDAPLPRYWKNQSDILYLENFFQHDKVRELVAQQAADQPGLAWVAFNQYRVAQKDRDGTAALAHLARAVELDPAYAAEYRQLAAKAFDSQQPDQAVRMLQLAAAAAPDDALLKLDLARLALEVGQTELGAPLLSELQRLEWSPVYYPDMPALLQSLREPAVH